MSYWIIRHKETGEWLPMRKGRTQTSAELTKVQPPRLFVSKGAAKRALRFWLGGIWWMEYRQTDFFREDFVLECHEQPNRVAEKMEIVEVVIVQVLPIKETNGATL